MTNPPAGSFDCFCTGSLKARQVHTAIYLAKGNSFPFLKEMGKQMVLCVSIETKE
jgi:hypothetical protein